MRRNPVIFHQKDTHLITMHYRRLFFARAVSDCERNLWQKCIIFMLTFSFFIRDRPAEARAITVQNECQRRTNYTKSR